MQVETQNFWHNLEKIQNVLAKSDEDFAAYLGVHSEQFIKKKRTRNSTLSVNCVYELAERLNFHFEDLLTNDFNTKSIDSLINGKFSILERYSIATHSKTRQIGNVLNYMERTRGESSKINMLRKFQLTEDFIYSGKYSVNVHLLTDMTSFLQKTYQFTNKEFFEIGQSTPFTSMNNDIAIALSAKKDIYELLDFFIYELGKSFDSNFDYRILKIEGDYAFIEASPYKHVIEELGIREDQFGNELNCLTKMGVISSITWFKYNRFAKIKKISSTYSGAKSNIYLFDISQFKHLSRLQNSGATVLNFKPHLSPKNY